MTSHKQELHRELKLRYREYFESKFAVALLKSGEKFSSLQKISKAICELISPNVDKILQLIKSNPKIKAEMTEPYFGSCFDKKDESTPENILESIFQILQTSSNIASVLQIHCIFIHRIYDQIVKDSKREDIISKLSPSALFSSGNRKRIEKKEEHKVTRQLGIARHSVFAKMVGTHENCYSRSVDRFEEDKLKQMPSVSGASGHTRSLIAGLQLYGNLTADEFKEYLLLCFAFLAAGGHHSFYEVMIVAQLINPEINPEDYTTCIPESIKVTDFYKINSRLFSEFLSESNSFKMNS